MEKVVSYHGGPIEEYPPQVVEVLPAPIARLVVSMLREVVNSGTARRAKSLGLPVAGKTGTTNDYSDASFVGFSSSITCGVWVGFDDRQSLGPREEGARVALPIWMEFMGEAHKDRPAEDFTNSPLLEFPDQVGEILNPSGNSQDAGQTSLEN
jgi:penicillin-binding protein 1A